MGRSPVSGQDARTIVRQRGEMGDPPVGDIAPHGSDTRLLPKPVMRPLPLGYASARIRSMVDWVKESAGTLSGPTSGVSRGPPSTGSVCQTAL